MFIVLTISDDNWSFQAYLESGATFGTADVYDNTNYRLDRNENTDSYMIYEANRTDGGFPPFAAYPRNRTILKRAT